MPTARNPFLRNPVQTSTGRRADVPMGGVEVEGLAELISNLRQIDPVLEKNLAKRFRVLARKVRDKIRAEVPRVSGAARKGYTSGATGKTAWVKLDKGKVAYLGWLDFGGVLKPKGRRRGTQRRPLTSGRRGRYLYPTVDDSVDDMLRDGVAALEETKRDLGLR